MMQILANESTTCIAPMMAKGQKNPPTSYKMPPTTGPPSWAMFMTHLVIEKILATAVGNSVAVYVKVLVMTNALATA